MDKKQMNNRSKTPSYDELTAKLKQAGISYNDRLYNERGFDTIAINWTHETIDGDLIAIYNTFSGTLRVTLPNGTVIKETDNLPDIWFKDLLIFLYGTTATERSEPIPGPDYNAIAARLEAAGIHYEYDPKYRGSEYVIEFDFADTDLDEPAKVRYNFISGQVLATCMGISFTAAHRSDLGWIDRLCNVIYTGKTTSNRLPAKSFKTGDDVTFTMLDYNGKSIEFTGTIVENHGQGWWVVQTKGDRVLLHQKVLKHDAKVRGHMHRHMQQQAELAATAASAVVMFIAPALTLFSYFFYTVI
jgi:hypothetical protein